MFENQTEFKRETYSRSAMPMDSDTAFKKGILFDSYLGTAQQPVADVTEEQLGPLVTQYSRRLVVHEQYRNKLAEANRTARKIPVATGLNTVCIAGLAYQIHGTPMNTDLGSAPEAVLIIGALGAAYLTKAFADAVKRQANQIVQQDKKITINTQNLQLLRDEMNRSPRQV